MKGKPLTEGKTLGDVKSHPLANSRPRVAPPGIKKANKTPLSLWEGLAAIKHEAADRLMGRILGATLSEIEVKEVDISPADTKGDLEELEIFLSLHLSFFLENVTSKQIEELLHTGDARPIDYSIKNETWSVEYNTSYGFEFDDETGRSSEGSFSG